MSGLLRSARDAANNGWPTAASHPASPGAVTVSASGRLHLGFLDPSSTLGRRFGSIGMMIEDTTTAVRVAFADVPRLGAAPKASHEIGRTGRIVLELQRSSGKLDPLDVHVLAALPAHVGLGSGTQLALALGRAFIELHGMRMSTPAIARLLGRGRRSGIGIAGFDHGGFLVDGGPGAVDAGAATVTSTTTPTTAPTTAPTTTTATTAAPTATTAPTATRPDTPPVLARFDFPEDWRVIVVQDPARSGLHGKSERSGLARLPEFTSPRAAHLCHLVLMQILPSLAEGDFVPFARGLSELQRVVGEYFAPVQGGVFSSPPVGRLMRWIDDHHVAAVGQSSWGPTSFAILPSHEEAQRVVAAAQASGMIEAGLDLNIVSGRNQGAVVARESESVRAAG